jgi:predicted glycoside hydrolase/deacetylase ChbG (UPF0249 family)
MGMKKLIVNADDFGLNASVTAGIVEAADVGVVCCSTAMACFPGAEVVIRRYAQSFRGQLGAHLQLTSGKPCLPGKDIPSLVENTGLFPRRPEQLGSVDPEQVYREFCAQIELLRSWSIKPTHLDTHHHVHQRPEVFSAIKRLGREYNLPIRPLSLDMAAELRSGGVRCADLCVTSWFNAGPNPTTLLDMLDDAFTLIEGIGTIELMTHPGHCDEELQQLSTYAFPRETELIVLTSARLIRGLKARGIELGHW